MDTIDYSSARGGVTVNLAQGSAVQAASGIGPIGYFTSGGTGGPAIQNVVQANDNRESNDQLVSIENVVGSNLDDSITGDAFDNVLEGRGGFDLIDGGGGNDVATFMLAAGTTGSLRFAQGQGGDSGKILIERVYGATVETVFKVTVGRIDQRSRVGHIIV